MRPSITTRALKGLTRPRWWIAIAIVSGLIVLLGTRDSKYRRTQEVIQDVERQGGSALALYDGPEWLEGVLNEYAPTLAPRFEARILSIGYAHCDDKPDRAPLDLKYLDECPDLRELDLWDARGVSDTDLLLVGQHLELERLSLSGSLITNTGLCALSPLHNLEGLLLAGTSIDDEGLRCLGQMPKLQWLRLGGNRGLTGTGLKHLSSNCRLVLLDLSETQFRTGLDAVDVASLQRFCANRTPMTDDTLALFKDANQLEMLWIGQTQVTDEGLKHIASLPKLNSLALNGTRITDAGIERLSGLPSLTLLMVHDTAVTRKAAERLVAELPALTVSYGPYQRGNVQYVEGAEVDPE